MIAAVHQVSRADAAVQTGPDDTTALQWDEACRLFSATLLEASESPG